MNTPRPWPDATQPTAAQLLDYLRAITTDEELDRARVNLDLMLRDSATAHRCAAMDHDNLTREADHTRRALYTALIAGNRYRLAWTNARRRATTTRTAALNLLTAHNIAPTIPRQDPTP